VQLLAIATGALAIALPRHDHSCWRQLGLLLGCSLQPSSLLECAQHAFAACQAAAVDTLPSLTQYQQPHFIAANPLPCVVYFVPPSCSYVLTQFQSHTLNSHIASCYPPMRFGSPDQQAWVDVLAAQQTATEREW
jgi:hypothetical protein